MTESPFAAGSPVAPFAVATEPTEPIARRRLADEVTERLLHRIRQGEFREGERMPSERELMRLFAVGRPTIREALQNLARMGLIAITHGERATLLPLSAQTVIDQVGVVARHLLFTSSQTLEHLKEARLFFEVGIVRIAAERATAEDIAAIRRALADHEATLHNLPDFLHRDVALHRAIAAVSRNPIYTALSEAMFGWLAEFHRDLLRVSGAERITLDEHARIVEAIERHDPDAAAKAMTAHLTRANRAYSQVGRKAPRRGRTKAAP